MIRLENNKKPNICLNTNILVGSLISYVLATVSPIAAQTSTSTSVQQVKQQNIAPILLSDQTADKALEQTKESTLESNQSWLLLYPQHPLYRQAVEKTNQQKSQNDYSQPNLPKTNHFEVTGSGTLPNNQATKSPNLAPIVLTSPPVKIIKPEVIPQVETQASTTNPAPLFIQPVEPPDPNLQPKPPKYFPSFNAGSPSGFGANWGDLFAGVSLINRSSPVGSATDKADGSIAIGAGFGNAQDLVGFETVYNLISLTPSRFASNGSFDFKVHRALPDLMSVAIGWENAINYGPEAGGTPSTVYGAFSKFFVLQPDNIENPMLLGLTIGTGGGRFRSFNDQVEGRGGVGVFASAGLQVLSNLSVITDWTGQNLNLGVSYVPFSNFPFYLNGTIVDAVGNTSFGVRYSLGVGFGFNFR